LLRAVSPAILKQRQRDFSRASWGWVTVSMLLSQEASCHPKES
jgi:hypothetical protein